MAKSEIKDKNTNNTSVVEKKEKIETPFKTIWKRLKKNKLAMAGLGILIFMILACVIGPLFTKDPNAKNYASGFAKPSSKFLLGSDSLGRDILARTLVAGRISLFVGIASVVIQVVIGSTLGVVAGYYGGIVDTIIMRIVDIFMSIPQLPILIVLAAILSDLGVPPEKRIFVVMAVIGLLHWPALCRMVRGQILSLREQEYMQAAEALGLNDRRKMFKHLLPNTIPVIIVSATLSLGGAILSESTLSFLGLGVQPPTPSWGNMIQTVYDMYNIQYRPWLWLPPGICIFLTVMAINLLGDGLRDAIDPKLKK
ncbi:ABC transporter permease [Clostridium sp. MSJ-4]|uniref:ABC transporter permease n=1 Tax=Clostridium simiarum TaxID=2841506 RepID=A0ABS6F1C7_9CLOT|nr:MULTISPECIES: oligopeptide ABC transporter permease [Clostridium]MBU5592053.1 ABC transporter permease [Clostridium simiarum]